VYDYCRHPFRQTAYKTGVFRFGPFRKGDRSIKYECNDGMKKSISVSKELIAPCGMNCAVCSRYLSYVNNVKPSQCAGCRQAAVSSRLEPIRVYSKKL
jgi:hypothetical protein